MSHEETLPKPMTVRQMRREYLTRKLETGELVNGFPLLYTATERPPVANTFVNGHKVPFYMLCWKLSFYDVERVNDLDPVALRRSNALPRWKSLGYADQFGCVVDLLPQMRAINGELIVLFGFNQSEYVISSIMRPEVMAAAKEAYNIPDDLPEDRKLEWRRMA
ncbi:hypothetical protein CPB85DRAFT_1336035 [Mucidula mucida]|nr:hypothetical protein CPB85DRAFT_1336035 [Mucidula mucida]